MWKSHLAWALNGTACGLLAFLIWLQLTHPNCPTKTTQGRECVTHCYQDSRRRNTTICQKVCFPIGAKWQKA